MESLRKAGLLILLSAFLLSANAQIFSFEAGYLNPHRLGTATGQTSSDDLRLGVQAEIPWKYNFGLLTGLYYNPSYATRTQNYSGDNYVDYTSWTHSLEIPIRAMYRIHFTKTLGIFIYGGPNIQAGLLNSTHIDAYLSDVLANMTGIQTGTTNDFTSGKLNRINLQLGTGGGIQWKSYILKGGYDWGMNNLNKDGFGILKQRDWHVSVAYQF